MVPSIALSVYFRIYCEDKQTFLQDCDDDGETAAGGRLLHLMEVGIELNSEYALTNLRVFQQTRAPLRKNDVWYWS